MYMCESVRVVCLDIPTHLQLSDLTNNIENLHIYLCELNIGTMRLQIIINWKFCYAFLSCLRGK